MLIATRFAFLSFVADVYVVSELRRPFIELSNCISLIAFLGLIPLHANLGRENLNCGANENTKCQTGIMYLSILQTTICRRTDC